MLKAVFFDMGGTLDTYYYTPEDRISKMCLIRTSMHKAGIQLSVSDIELADMITRGASAYLHWNLQSTRELKPAQIWARFFLKDLLLSPESLAPVAEELAYIYETALFIRKPRTEILEVLEKISQMGLKIGCVSNTQSQTQVPSNLKEYGIIHYFDPIVMSSVYGRRKPDPSIFYYAARMANVPTGACIYVGDKASRDILGARRAGFRLAVQIKNPEDMCVGDEGPAPDALITDMRDLIPIIEKEIESEKQLTALQNNRKIKALFFDAGDILYHRPQKGKNLKHFLAEKNIQLDFEIEQRLRSIRNLAYSGQIGRRAYYQQALHLYGITEPEDLARGVAAMNLDDNTIEIIEGVPETIRQLKAQGYILGIITDTALSYSKKLKWFEHHGFGDVWDTVISSKEIGVRKPSAIMYEKAITQTGVRACDAVFVGHKKLELDGARAVGMQTVAFNYEEGAIADIYIHDIRELPLIPLLRS